MLEAVRVDWTQQHVSEHSRENWEEMDWNGGKEQPQRWT